MTGNMRSRWTDFRQQRGKPAGDRDSEFVDPPATRVFQALEPLSDADLARTVTIRGEANSVMQAVNRQASHYAYHVGQIVMVTVSECAAEPVGGV